MQADIDNLRTLRANGFSAIPKHGKAPETSFTKYVSSSEGVFLGIGVAFLAFLIFWAIFSFQHSDHKAMFGFKALERGIAIGFWIIVFYYTYPLFVMLFKTIFMGEWPSKVLLSRYSRAQICISCITFSFFLCFLLNSATGILISAWHGHFSWSSRYISSTLTYSLTSLSLGIVLGILLPEALPYETKSRALKKKERESIRPVVDTNNIPFGLWVGRSTGYLSQLWHRTGVAADQNISLGIEDAAQNILVLGGIGSGKTTRLMQPLLTQLLEQECGGLLFDVKGDVKKAVLALAEHCNVDVAIIGPGEDTWAINVLRDISPEMAASFFKSIFLLSGGTRTEGFWIDTAVELCRNTLGILSFIDGYYRTSGSK